MYRFVLALVFVLLAAAAASAQEMRIAAVVNDDVISMADLDARIRLIMLTSNFPDTPEVRKRLTPQILHMLVDEKLELQEAKRLKITVPQKEIDAAMARVEEHNHLKKGGLDAFLSAHGLDRASLSDQVTSALAWQKVVQARGYMARPISDEDIEDAINRQRQDEDHPRLRLAEIFLVVDSPQQDDEVRQFADRLIEQMRGGTAFAALARQFSQSATAAVGGDMGWITPSELTPELANAAEHMQTGQVSPPIRAGGGYYIIAVINKQMPGGGADDERVSLTQIMFPLAADAPPEQRQKIMAQAEAVTKAAKSCADMAEIGRREAPRSSGDIGAVRIGDLPDSLRATVAKLKIGEPSPPLPLRGGIGILMVCRREGTPEAMPTRDEITQELGRERFDGLARRYLRDLRRAAYVDVRG